MPDVPAEFAPVPAAVDLAALAPRDRGGSAQAAHMELTGLLSALINSGQLRPGVRLPPEREMCRQFGVSRTTIRHVLDRLERLHLITRHVGRGTFVAEPKTVHTMSLPSSMVTDREPDVTYAEIYRDVREPSDRMRDLLTLSEGEEVCRTARVRSVSGGPASVEVTHFPRTVFERLDPELLASAPVGAAFRAADVGVTKSRQRYDPVLSDPWESGQLDVPVGTPLMLVTRRSWDAGERVVEYTLEYHRADRNSFLIEVTGRP